MYEYSNEEVIASLSDDQLRVREKLAALFKDKRTGTDKIFFEHIMFPMVINHNEWTKDELNEEKLAIAYKGAKEYNIYPFEVHCLEGSDFLIPTKTWYEQLDSQVHLSETEEKICKYLAMCRYANNVINMGLGDNHLYLKGEEFHRVGFQNEFAGSKLLNIYPEFSVKVNSAKNGKDIGDGRVHHLNMNVDWKTCGYSNSIYIKKTKQNNDIQLYGAMQRMEDGWYRCMGFISAEKAYEIGAEGRYGSYQIKASQLKPIDEYLI
jgi:hypothetical protein